MNKTKTSVLSVLVVSTLFAAAAVSAKNATAKADQMRSKTAVHNVTDPKVYIPLREEMTAMEMKFVDIQIMSVADTIDYKAIQKALEQMGASAKKIRAINPKEALREPLQKLSSQLTSLQRDAHRKNKVSLKANLDGLFETCFKCHQSHAPLM